MVDGEGSGAAKADGGGRIPAMHAETIAAGTVKIVELYEELAAREKHKGVLVDAAHEVITI